MIKKLIPFTAQNKKPSFWWLGLKLGLLVALLLWWWMQDDFSDEKRVSDDRIELAPDGLDDTPSAADEHAVVTPDDLTKIDGIGPKYAQVLQAADVVTFAQLAVLHPENIREIFQAAGGRVPNPTAWPERAAQLAAA
jgi:predicted flap endonuclease-1-like 5' DNA nuclease